MIIDLYKTIGEDLVRAGHITGSNIELLGSHYELLNLDLLGQLGESRDDFIAYLEDLDYPLERKAAEERFHYEKLYSTLSHAIAENYFYLKEDFVGSRRFIALSSDCISCIQCKCLPDRMTIHVFFRSSHYYRLLPVDLLFIMGLPHALLDSANHIKETFQITTWSELESIKYVDFYLTFGSLHAQSDFGGRVPWISDIWAAI